jgi:hypothetical protein
MDLMRERQCDPYRQIIPDPQEFADGVHCVRLIAGSVVWPRAVDVRHFGYLGNYGQLGNYGVDGIQRMWFDALTFKEIALGAGLHEFAKALRINLRRSGGGDGSGTDSHSRAFAAGLHGKRNRSGRRLQTFNIIILYRQQHMVH